MLDDRLLNAGYGALANKHFLYFRIENAESITTTGQLVNRWTSERTNDLINKLVGNKDKKNYIVNNDTDSVVGDTIIHVNDEQITIEEYFNRQSQYIRKDDFNRQYVVKCENDVTYSIDDDKTLVKRPIKYAMKHAVKKRMYSLTVDGKSVTVTEDHGLIALRDGKLVCTKPANLKKSDKIITL